jgi:hypothetical protein
MIDQDTDVSVCEFCTIEGVELTEFRGHFLCPYCYGTFSGNMAVWPKAYSLNDDSMMLLKCMMGAFNILEKRLRDERNS